MCAIAEPSLLLKEILKYGFSNNAKYNILMTEIVSTIKNIYEDNHVVIFLRGSIQNKNSLN